MREEGGLEGGREAGMGGRDGGREGGRESLSATPSSGQRMDVLIRTDRAAAAYAIGVQV
jgi:hypothetical protein